MLLLFKIKSYIVAVKILLIRNLKMQLKKTNQKDHQKYLGVKMVRSKTTCPKWHLSQTRHGPFGVPFD